MVDLTGTRVAIVATDGYEDSELTEPWNALADSGAEVVLIAPEAGTITGKNGHVAEVALTTEQAHAKDFHLLVLPGGLQNGDDIRLDGDAIEFVRDLATSGAPVGAICHGGWILTDADVVRGRTMTSYPSLRTDLINAGATWVNEEVVVDAGLITSRTPNDLPSFCAALLEAAGAASPLRT